MYHVKFQTLISPNTYISTKFQITPENVNKQEDFQKTKHNNNLQESTSGICEEFWMKLKVWENQPLWIHLGLKMVQVTR